MASSISSRRLAKETRSNRLSQDSRSLSLSHQLHKVLRHPLVLLTCLLIGALLGALVSSMQTPQYEATSKVIVYPMPVDPNAQASNQMTVNIDTEASVAASQEVADAAAKKMDSSNHGLPDALKNGVKITPHSGSAILDFTGTADSAEKAEKYANAVAESYLDVRQDAMKKHVDANTQQVRQSIRDLGDTNNGTKAALEEKLAQVEVTSTEPGRVITVADAPSQTKNLDLWKFVMVGAIAGLLLGAIIAAVLDSKNRRVKYADRASDIARQDVFTVRESHEVEDVRRLLLSLEVDQEDSSAQRRGIVLYSPTAGAAKEFAEVLSGSIDNSVVTNSDWVEEAASTPLDNEAQGKTLIAVPENDEISNVIKLGRSLGQCVVIIRPESAVKDLKDFVQTADSTGSQPDYVFVQK